MSRIASLSPFDHRHDLFHAVGWVDGGVVTDAGSETVDVTAGIGFLRIADTQLADIKYINWPVNLAIAIATDTTVYIGVEYNNGSPQVFSTTDLIDFTKTTKFCLARVVNVSATLTITSMLQTSLGHSPVGMVETKTPIAGMLWLDGFNLNIYTGTEWKDLHEIVDALLAFFNGIFLEEFDALVTSNGTIITLSLEADGGSGGDLTMVFSDGHTILDCTPACTITLTAGSDISPQSNFIYVLKSDKILTKSTSSWPVAEHIKIGYFLVQSASTVQSTGALVNQNWNDHAKNCPGAAVDQGHLTHITERMRHSFALYASGIDLTVTIVTASSPDDVFISTTSGVVWQLHKHTHAILDSDPAGAGDLIYMVNDSVTSYKTVNNLNLELTDSIGGSMSNRYYNLVIWGVANKTGEYSSLFVNLPSGSYASLANAIADTSGFNNHTIPSVFTVDSSTGFLIARITLKHGSAGTHSLENTVDLRGFTPQSAAGGGAVTAQTEFADNAFKLFDESDITKELVFQLSGLATATTLTINADELDTLTDASNADALHTHTKYKTHRCVQHIRDPLVGDDFPIGIRAHTAITITEIHGIVDSGTVTFSLYLRFRHIPFSGGSLVNTNPIVADTDGEEDDGVWTDNTAPINAGVYVVISGITGVPTQFEVEVEYTID